ncbi:hypothetical protein BCF50_1672 [Chryseobacterium daecheongense]|uniref:Uncharacterized protein n=1 Tax=Chryseobacterium daecheongense TaxID=192389 RepID=A0ABY2FUT6_9FLAO|nr:hypothetical protein BCF50_1672 [Chryseobacterium daecheongense]
MDNAENFSAFFVSKFKPVAEYPQLREKLLNLADRKSNVS